MNWMNLASRGVFSISRTLNCGNALNLQDFHCSAKVGRKRRRMYATGCGSPTKTKAELAGRNKSNNMRLNLDVVPNDT